jgi:DNA replication protein DnaC
MWETDKTITNLAWVPEYECLVYWMHNNRGKGLCLRGDCGRGKSSILLGVIPVIFMMKFNKVVRVTQAEDLPKEYPKLLAKKIIAIDDLGTEPMLNDYGEKSEVFNRLINLSEKELRLLFVTTNLGRDDILTRYGNRTWERLNRLCYVINFKGESLRS